MATDTKDAVVSPPGYRLPVDGETLWTAKVEPSIAGSGVLPPNPVFPEVVESREPSPELEELIKAFSTPTTGEARDRLDRITFP